MNDNLAQKLILPGNLTGTPAPGDPSPTALISGPLKSTTFPDLASIMSRLLPLLLSIAGILLFMYLIWGGYSYLLSGGDPQKMESGKHKITNAIIGFVIIFLSYFLTQLIGFIFGLELF